MRPLVFTEETEKNADGAIFSVTGLDTVNGNTKRRGCQ